MIDELKALNEIWNRAWLQKDVETVDRLAAPEYVYVGPNGRVLDRGAILMILKSPSYQLYGGTRTDVLVKQLSDDAAVVLHRWQGEGTFAGTSFKDDHQCSMVCVRRDGEWQIVLEHCSSKS